MKPTEETSRLIAAYKQVCVLDLEKLFASGIDVALLNYTPERPQHMERVTIAAERFEPVRNALREVLMKEIIARQQAVARELDELEKITGLLS